MDDTALGFAGGREECARHHCDDSVAGGSAHVWLCSHGVLVERLPDRSQAGNTTLLMYSFKDNPYSYLEYSYSRHVVTLNCTFVKGEPVMIIGIAEHFCLFRRWVTLTIGMGHFAWQE